MTSQKLSAPRMVLEIFERNFKLQWKFKKWKNVITKILIISCSSSKFGQKNIRISYRVFLAIFCIFVSLTTKKWKKFIQCYLQCSINCFSNYLLMFNVITINLGFLGSQTCTERLFFATSLHAAPSARIWHVLRNLLLYPNKMVEKIYSQNCLLKNSKCRLYT